VSTLSYNAGLHSTWNRFTAFSVEPEFGCQLQRFVRSASILGLLWLALW